MRRRLRGLCIAVFASLMLLGGATSASAQAERETSFEAADPEYSKHKENLSGIPFMVSSYLIVWSGLFAYLISVKKRNNAVQAEIADLKRALEAHDRSGA